LGHGVQPIRKHPIQGCAEQFVDGTIIANKYIVLTEECKISLVFWICRIGWLYRKFQICVFAIIFAHNLKMLVIGSSLDPKLKLLNNLTTTANFFAHHFFCPTRKNDIRSHPYISRLSMDGFFSLGKK
jgi:hypothetical protein